MDDADYLGLAVDRSARDSRWVGSCTIYLSVVLILAGPLLGARGFTIAESMDLLFKVCHSFRGVVWVTVPSTPQADWPSIFGWRRAAGFNAHIGFGRLGASARYAFGTPK